MLYLKKQSNNQRKDSWLRWFLLFPALYLIVILGISMIRLFGLAFFNDTGFTLEYLIRVFTVPVYLRVILHTLATAIIVMIISVTMAYPLAYLSVRAKKKSIRELINTVVMMTFCTSILVRNFSLIILLQNNGVINSFLLSIGVVSEPIKLVYNTTGVIIGLVLSLIPYAYLSLTAVMEKIDNSLVMASEALGAKPYRSFLKIYLPLSKQGIYGGSLIVFVLAIGFYITPTLLGGADNTMISVLIQENVNRTLNWNLAAALSLVLFIFSALILLVIFKFIGLSIFIPESDISVRRYSKEMYK